MIDTGTAITGALRDQRDRDLDRIAEEVCPPWYSPTLLREAWEIAPLMKELSDRAARALAVMFDRLAEDLSYYAGEPIKASDVNEHLLTYPEETAG